MGLRSVLLGFPKISTRRDRDRGRMRKNEEEQEERKEGGNERTYGAMVRAFHPVAPNFSHSSISSGGACYGTIDSVGCSEEMDGRLTWYIIALILELPPRTFPRGQYIARSATSLCGLHSIPFQSLSEAI